MTWQTMLGVKLRAHPTACMSARGPNGVTRDSFVQLLENCFFSNRIL